VCSFRWKAAPERNCAGSRRERGDTSKLPEKEPVSAGSGAAEGMLTSG
jgi:hypothetical protein